MALEKLTIFTVESRQVIEAHFNPNSLSIQKTANWRDMPVSERDVPESQFTHGNAAVLSLDLLFDTYESGIDVRVYTAQVAHLTTVTQHGEIHRPPVCQLAWGMAGIFFQGVLQSLNQNFTLFLASGTPVRATLSCSFKEWHSSEDEAKLQNRESADLVKTRTIKRGDTLSSIAVEEYNDPALWRPIAEANGIDNPLSLVPGMRLIIPTLRNRSGGKRL